MLASYRAYTSYFSFVRMKSEVDLIFNKGVKTMDIWGNHKTALGYETNDGGVDSYGVDHSGFSLRDELEYQFARSKREQELIENHNKQGIAKENYPQYGTNFWGSSPENNYGFGASNIIQNIQNVTNQLNGGKVGNNANSGQVFANSDYMVNTENVVGQPNSYIQNNNTNNTANTIGQSNSNTIGNNNSIFQGFSTFNPASIGYNIGQKIGELAADTKLAYDYWQKMNNTGKQLVNTYGSGQGADIDNYYHPLLQCELAKISPQSRANGIALGYAKEYLMDYPKKRFIQHQSHSETMKDSRKDLQNNLYGSNLGYNNPNKNCEDLLDDRRTPNMRKLGIR